MESRRNYGSRGYETDWIEARHILCLCEAGGNDLRGAFFTETILSSPKNPPLEDSLKNLHQKRRADRSRSMRRNLCFVVQRQDLPSGRGNHGDQQEHVGESEERIENSIIVKFF